MQFVYQFIGLDATILSHDTVTKAEKRLFLAIGCCLILNGVFAFLGAGQLFYLTTYNWIAAICAAVFWSFVFINLYRILLIISFNNLETSVGLVVNRIFKAVIVLLLGAFGAFGFMFFIIQTFQPEIIPSNFQGGIISAVGVIETFKANNTILYKILFRTIAIIMLIPYLIIVSSKTLKLGGYLKLAKEQEKNIIIGNYQVFKEDYPQVLANSIGEEHEETIIPNANYDFYEPYEDAPFNTIKKIEW